jgi:DNA-binding NarL/FixJ family response regulator
VIKIVLVDDHAVVRSGLRLLLDAQDDLEVVGEAGNAKDAVFRADRSAAGAVEGVPGDQGAGPLDGRRSELRP